MIWLDWRCYCFLRKLNSNTNIFCCLQINFFKLFIYSISFMNSCVSFHNKMNALFCMLSELFYYVAKSFLFFVYIPNKMISQMCLYLSSSCLDFCQEVSKVWYTFNFILRGFDFLLRREAIYFKTVNNVNTHVRYLA